jgi:hypothetical protein
LSYATRTLLSVSAKIIPSLNLLFLLCFLFLSFFSKFFFFIDNSLFVLPPFSPLYLPDFFSLPSPQYLLSVSPIFVPFPFRLSSSPIKFHFPHPPPPRILRNRYSLSILNMYLRLVDLHVVDLYTASETR